MRITINHAVLAKRYEERGLLRLSAQAEDRTSPTIEHLATLVDRHGVTLAEIATITHDAPLAQQA